MLKSISNIFTDFTPKGDKSYSDKRKSKSRNYPGSSFDFISLIKAWEKIVGANMAKHTIPLKLQNKTLFILSNHPAFSASVSFMEEGIKTNIFKEFPNLKAGLKNLSFQINPTFFETQKNSLKGQISGETKTQSPKLHPYSPKYKKLKKEAIELVGDIEDQELKESLISIYMQMKA